MSRASAPSRGTARDDRHLGYVAAAVVFAIGMAGTTLPTPLYGLYREELGFSELMVTVIFASYAVGVIATLLLVGNHSDAVGRRPVLWTALGLAAASALFFLFEGGLPFLFAGRLLSGFSAGLLSGAGTVTVLELARPERKSRAGFAATAANMGGLGCGPLLSGLLAEYAPRPLSLPFLAHLVLVGIGCVIVLFLPETVKEPRLLTRPRPPGLYVPSQVRGIFTPRRWPPSPDSRCSACSPRWHRVSSPRPSASPIWPSRESSSSRCSSPRPWGSRGRPGWPCASPCRSAV